MLNILRKEKEGQPEEAVEVLSLEERKVALEKERQEDDQKAQQKEIAMEKDTRAKLKLVETRVALGAPLPGAKELKSLFDFGSFYHEGNGSNIHRESIQLIATFSQTDRTKSLLPLIKDGTLQRVFGDAVLLFAAEMFTKTAITESDKILQEAFTDVIKANGPKIQELQEQAKKAELNTKKKKVISDIKAILSGEKSYIESGFDLGIKAIIGAELSDEDVIVLQRVAKGHGKFSSGIEAKSVAAALRVLGKEYGVPDSLRILGWAFNNDSWGTYGDELVLAAVEISLDIANQQVLQGIYKKVQHSGMETKVKIKDKIKARLEI